jgi:XXXCH domain-containing protein
LSSSKKAKNRVELSPRETASFLRQLADALEDGRVRFREQELELSGQVRVDEALKSKDDAEQLQVKITLLCAAPVAVTPAGEETAPAVEQKAAPAPAPEAKRPSYKKLKKAMAKVFKEIRQATQEGGLPPAEAVAEFCRQGRLMITYPDKGDEYYPAFAAGVDRLEKAAADGDLDAFSQAYNDLKEMRSSCHDKYK